MQTKVIRWLVLPIGILAFAGCRNSPPADCEHSQPVDIDLSTVPPSQPFIFYDEMGDPSERTPALREYGLREVVNSMAGLTQDPVWLIRVRPSEGTEEHTSMVAYLVPDEATTRIRAGQAYDVYGLKGQTGEYSPWKYAQVSMPGRSFTAQFAKPSVTEIPFKWPVVADRKTQQTSPMSKEEVVNIVDFVCQPSNYERWAGKDGPRRANMSLVSYDRPILEIERCGNKIVVTFGFLHAPLWGHGHIVRIERTATGYRIIEVSGWIS